MIKEKLTRMLKVGLTGGIASGKTTVSNYFAQLGAEIIDADKIDRELTVPNAPLWEKIVNSFGKDILDDDNKIVRKRLANLVFNDNNKEKLQLLNNISHPLILNEIERRLEEIRQWTIDNRQETIKIVIINAALLIESGYYKKMDKVVVVSVNKDNQLRRLMERDKLTYKEAVERVGLQMPLEEKIKYADFVIDNNGQLEDTFKQVKEIYFKLMMNLKR
ncbi:MAG: dephospho-CoA kinase [bacterium]